MIIILKIIFLLGFLILIHEGGHFLIAKFCKIKVNQFSIGFGPKLISKKIGETNYELRLVPLGGFVNLEGEDNNSNDINSFNNAKTWKKIAVISAGALVNIAFGVLLYFAVVAVRYGIMTGSSLGDSISYSFTIVIKLFQNIFQGIIQLFTGGLGINDMMGPVGISAMVSKTTGIVEFLFLLSIISISLGITNLLPLIPLDGGKIVLIIIEKIRKKPLKKETEAKIQAVGFLFLMFFSIIVTFNDVLKLF